MGCRGSKMEPEQEAKLHPIFMAKRHGGLSKKQLLAADANVHHRESLLEEEEEDATATLPSLSNEDGYLTFQQTQDCPPTLQIISPIIIENNYAPSNNSSTQVLEDIKVDYDNNNVVDDDDDIQEQHLHEMEASEEENEMDYIDDLAIGSPSFRVYCIHSVSVDDELDELAEQLHSQEFVGDEKVYSRQESPNSNEVVLEKEVLKKHKRGIRKLRMITIPKAAGKSIMHNMQSLYHFPCNSNNNHSQFVQQAAA